MERETKTYKVAYRIEGKEFRYPTIYRTKRGAVSRGVKLVKRHGFKAFCRIIETTVTEKIVRVI